MKKRWLILGALMALCAVAAGALGDHLIRPKMLEWYPGDADKRIANWDVAGRYLFYHAIAMCLVGLLPGTVAGISRQISGSFFLLGTLLFSGCLFAYVLSDHKWLVQWVPFGGGCFLLGWLCFIVAVARADRAPR